MKKKEDGFGKKFIGILKFVVPCLAVSMGALCLILSVTESEEDLEAMEERRQNMQNNYLNRDLDDQTREMAWDEMNRLDIAMAKLRSKEGDSSHAVHREHGWYLPNDED